MCRTAFRAKIAIPCRHSWHRVAGFVSRWTASGRATEATQADVDFHGGTLHIRHSKFDKSRLIPIAADLVKHLVHCRTLTTEKVGSCLTEICGLSKRSSTDRSPPPGRRWRRITMNRRSQLPTAVKTPSDPGSIADSGENWLIRHARDTWPAVETSHQGRRSVRTIKASPLSRSRPDTR